MNEYGQFTPYLRVAMNQHCDSGYRLPARVIFDHYLACVAEGAMLAEVEGKSYELEKGDFVFICPNELHSFRCYSNRSVNLPHIHFDFFNQPNARDVFISFKARDELTSYQHLFRPSIRKSGGVFNLPTVIRPSHFERPLDYLMRIITLQDRTSVTSTLEQQGYFFLLFGHLLHIVNATEVFDNPRHLQAMDRFMEMVRTRFHKPLTLEEMAEYVHLSPSHFSHLFKQFYQVSPMQFLRNFRIEQVKRLILTTNDSLTGIADKCGFSSIHSLSRTFREVTGSRPSDFLRGVNPPAKPTSTGCEMGKRLGCPPF